jgi:ribosome maturation factor RimP
MWTRPRRQVLKTETDIWTLVEPFLAAEHLELDDLEVVGSGQGRILRVVVDGEDLDIDRLATVSRSISRMLDKEEDLDDPFQLEVTSPGLERKLKRPAHFAKSVGREVVVKARIGEEKRTVRGVLGDVNEDSFTVNGDDGSSIVGFGDVLTAKTVFMWEKAPKPGH